jgi:transketolase
LIYEALLAADKLKSDNINTEVINCSTIKPLDSETLLRSAKKTNAVLSVEEAQINGGLGGAVAELLSENLPTPLKRVGVNDRFGQSGKIAELWQEYQLNSDFIRKFAINLVKRKK